MRIAFGMLLLLTLVTPIGGASAESREDVAARRAEDAATRAEAAATRSEAAAVRVEDAFGRLEKIIEELERREAARTRDGGRR